MKNISIAIVEPNEIFLQGLKRIFSKSRFRIDRECGSVAELCAAVPDGGHLSAILVETCEHAAMTESDLERLRSACPDAKIILMSEPEECREVMRIGENADGLILKSSAPVVLVKALELIVLGERIFPVAAWQRPRNAHPETPIAPRKHIPRAFDSLSDREVEVMHLLCNGSPNKIIARQLGISEATVKVHIKAILRKTQAKNRTEAALLMSSLIRTGASSH